MRSRRLGAALAVGALTLVGVAGPAQAQSAGACTPTWQIVDAPATPAIFSGIGGGAVDAISPDNVWFPGYVDGNWVPSQTWMGHWNGSSITTAPAVPKSVATSQMVNDASFDTASDGWIVGEQLANAVPDSLYFQPFAAHWDGHRWTTIPLPPSPELGRTHAQPEAVAAISPTDAWSVGAKRLPFNTTGTLIEHWDGSQWSIVPDPSSNSADAEFAAVKAISATDVWAVGRQVSTDGTVVPLAEHYDGTSWQLVDVPAGAAPAAFYAVSATGPDDVWAVGDDTLPDSGGLARPMVEHFDGTTWTVTSDLPDVGNLRLDGVYAASPTDVWATEYVPDNTQVGMLHYDGTTWTQVQWPGAPEYGQYSWALGIDGTGPNDIWALGGVTNNPGSTAGGTELRIAHLTCGGS